jgi:hypothetical protein
MIPSEENLSIHGHCWVPRDDQTCWVWTISWNPDGPLSQGDCESIRNDDFVHAQVDPSTFRPLRNKDNGYLINRDLQRTTSMTGIHGFAAQDQALQESMGPLVDRTLERLGISDTAIIAARRRLLQEIRGLSEDSQLFAATHGDIYWVRSASLLLNRGIAFDEVSKELTKAEV